MGRVAYRNKWLRLHDRYSNQTAKELSNVFRQWNTSIQWQQMTETNYEAVIQQAVNTNELSTVYIDVYRQVSFDYGKRVGKSINAQLKEFTLTAFTTLLERSIFQFFINFGIGRVVTVENTYKETIANLIANRLQEGKTIVEAAREVQEIVGKRRFYRWQAMRIARTETTAAANFGAIQAGDVSGFRMQKEWISALDARTRRPPEDKYDHYDMNGKRVGLNEKFNVSGELLEYPGDPKGSAGNVIACRCTVAVVPARDSNGDLIPV